MHKDRVEFTKNRQNFNSRTLLRIAKVKFAVFGVNEDRVSSFRKVNPVSLSEVGKEAFFLVIFLKRGQNFEKFSKQLSQQNGSKTLTTLYYF